MASSSRPNQSSSPFKGGGVFASDDPKKILQMQNKPAWVALEVDNGGKLRGGIDKSFVDQLKAQGIKVYIWAPGYNGIETVGGVSALNDSAISAANQTGADGVIFQGETPQEIQAAYGSVGKTNLQTAIVGDPGAYATSSWVNPKTTFLAEAYNNANPYASVPAAVANAQRAGAVDVVPIFGYYDDRSVHPTVPMYSYLDQAKDLGINNYGVFNIETLAGSPNDQQALSDSFSRQNADKPMPQLYKPSPADPANPFKGVGAFTASAPGFALSLAGTINWVAIKAGGGDGVGPGGANSADIISQAKVAGLTTVIWANPVAGDYAAQLAANQQAIALAQQYGAAGVIFPAMDPTQLQAAQAAGAQTNLPKAIIGGVATVGAGQVGGWGGSVLLLGDGMTPEQLAAYAAANPKIVPIIPSYGATNTDHSLPTYLTDFQNKGLTGFGVFTLESLSNDPTNTKAYLNNLVARRLGTLPKTAVTGSGGSSTASSAGHQTSRSRRQAKTTGSSRTKKTQPPLGIQGPHDPAGSQGAPPPYTGGAPVIHDPSKTFSFTDKKGRRVTITTTTSGAQVEQIAGINPKTGKNYTPYLIAPKGTINIPTPAWNTGTELTNSMIPLAPLVGNKLESHGMALAGRDSKDGTSLILRMSDGKYVSVNKTTGEVSPAGIWGDGKGGGVAKNDISNPTHTAAARLTASTAGTTTLSTSSASSARNKPAPLRTNPNQTGSVFDMPSAFTSGDPNQASYVPGVKMVFFKVGGADGATVEQIKKFMAAHPDVKGGIWQSDVTQEGIDTANQLGMPFVAQAESPDQYKAALALGSQLKGPKALVTGVSGVIAPGQWPAGWSGLIEAYQNDNPNATPANMVFAAKQAGAKDIVLVLGTYEGARAVPMTDYLAELSKLGITNFSVFSLNAMSAQDQQAFKDWLAKYPTTTAQPSTPTQTAAQPEPQVTNLVNISNTPKRKPTTPEPLGIEGPHQKAGSYGAPPPYTGGAPVVDNPNNPNDTFSFTDKKGRRVTITRTTSGAVIEQVGGTNSETGKPYTPYTVKKAPETPVDTTKPAWHQNPNWATSSSSSAAPAKLDPSLKVLEQRPGANGNTIYRVVDASGKGIYKILHPDGSVSDAGTWNASQWEPTKHGTTNPPSDLTISGGSGTPTTSNTPTDTNPLGVFVDNSNQHGSCFIAGTKVLAPDGETAIEDLKVGDKVLSWDLDRRTMVPAEVIETLAHKDKQTLELLTEGGSVTTTREHRFWTGSEWLAAGQLTAHASSVMDKTGQPQKVTAIKHHNHTSTVYHIHVSSPHHNYFAGGLLGHNMKVTE